MMLLCQPGSTKAVRDHAALSKAQLSPVSHDLLHTSFDLSRSSILLLHDLVPLCPAHPTRDPAVPLIMVHQRQPKVIRPSHHPVLTTILHPHHLRDIQLTRRLSSSRFSSKRSLRLRQDERPNPEPYALETGFGQGDRAEDPTGDGSDASLEDWKTLERGAMGEEGEGSFLIWVGLGQGWESFGERGGERRLRGGEVVEDDGGWCRSGGLGGVCG